MASAKDIIVKPISASAARAIVKRIHYSGKVVNNSQLHFGVFLDGKCEGAMQFGPSMMKRGLMKIVSGTSWGGFIELNRMAFSEKLPRNSESRAMSVAFKIMRKNYPHIEWVVSFADGTQCGDGTIYRAAGFVLTGIKKNTGILRLKNGNVGVLMTYTKGKHILNTGGAKKPESAEIMEGFQLRYIYFLNPEARKRLTVPILPFSRIDEMGAGMYRGIKREKQAMAGSTSTAAAQHRPSRSSLEVANG